MVSNKLVYLLLAVIAVNLITAQEQSTASNDSDSSKDHKSNNNQRRSSFGFGFPPFFGSGFGFPLPSFSPLNFSGSRDRRSELSGNDENFNNGPNNYERFQSIVRCNYTTERGRTCVSCNQTLICSQLNFGILATCRGHRPHCNQGFCSRTPSEASNSTSSE